MSRNPQIEDESSPELEPNVTHYEVLVAPGTERP